MTQQPQTIINQGKFTQKGAIAGTTGIALGLMILFGGVDIPAVAVVMSLWALIIAIKNGKLTEVYNGLGRNAIALLILSAAIFYMFYTRSHDPKPINETIKTFVLGGIFLPFGIWAFIRGNPEDKIIAGRGLIAGFAFAAILLSAEALNGYLLYHIVNPDQDPKDMERNLGRGAFILVTFLWPVLLALKTQKIDTKAIIFVSVLTIFLSTRFGLDLNFVVLIVSAIAAFAALKFPKIILGIITLVATFLMASAPWFYKFLATWSKGLFPAGHMPLSYERRADMWLYAIDRINEKFISGWGLDAARNFKEQVELGGYMWSALQNHPHSAPLNVWLEGGAIAGVLFTLAIIAGGIILIKTAGKNKYIAFSISGSLTAIICAWALSYGAWQQWLWVVLMFAIVYPFTINTDELTTREKKSSEFEEL